MSNVQMSHKKTYSVWETTPLKLEKAEDVLNLQTNKLMEKGRTLKTNMVLICYLILKEGNIHTNFTCINDNFDHPHINVVLFVLRKRSKSHNVFHKSLLVSH